MKALQLIGKWVLDLMYKLISRTFMAFVVYTVIVGLFMVVVTTTKNEALINAPWVETMFRWQGIVTMLYIAGCLAAKAVVGVFKKGLPT